MSSFTTIEASRRLLESMEIAINNMIEEVKRPVDQDLSGSARKAELQSVKQTVIDCKDLIVQRQQLIELIKSLEESGEIGEQKDFSSGFAEKMSKR